jgi:hypothetical protein
MFHLEFPFSFPFDPFAFGIFDDFWICLVGFCYCLLVSCDGLFFLTDSIFDIRVWRLKWRPALMFFFGTASACIGVFDVPDRLVVGLEFLVILSFGVDPLAAV